MKKKALGKGLDALFNSFEMGINEEEIKENVLFIDISQIERNPEQPRKHINNEDIEALATSIKSNGLIQPIIARKLENGKYIIIAGERRYLASKLAGLEKIPVIVRNIEKEKMLEIALIENIQRENLNPIDEANAFNILIEKLNLTHEELSKRIGKSRVYITNSIRLLKLDFDIKELLIEGKISKGHAIAILQIEDKSAQKKLIEEVINKKLSVRELEKIIRKRRKIKKIEKAEKRKKSPFINEIEQKLTYKFNTKVEIKGDLNKGKIIIEYFSKDFLENLLNK